jgi:hypothetical protein
VKLEPVNRPKSLFYFADRNSGTIHIRGWWVNMPTTEDYLAKADEFDGLGYYARGPALRAEYCRRAQEMRRAAILVRQC